MTDKEFFRKRRELQKALNMREPGQPYAVLVQQEGQVFPLRLYFVEPKPFVGVWKQSPRARKVLKFSDKRIMDIIPDDGVEDISVIMDQEPRPSLLGSKR